MGWGCTKTTRLVLVLLLASTTVAASPWNTLQEFPVTLMANFSALGVRATLTFTQYSPENSVKVIKDGAIFRKDEVTWQVYTFRVLYDVVDRCRVDRLGPSIYTEGISNDLELTGQNSIEGRSIALVNNSDGTILSCANVEQGGSYVTTQAVFRKNIVGTVILRQSKMVGSPTRVTTDLFFRGQENNARNLKWRIVEGSDCNVVLPPFDPKPHQGVCSEQNQENCAIGDLTGKLGEVSVGAEKGSARWTGLDLSLPLSGDFTVTGKTLQIFREKDMVHVDCAPISAFVEHLGVAVISQKDVWGKILMSQPSPFDLTAVVVKVVNLRSKAGAYRIHNLPVPQRLLAEDDVCDRGSVSGSFNPFDLDHHGDEYPGPGESTEDLYEVGDLSGKYGMLTSLDEIRETFTDYNLPLFGRHSVIGRALVIEKIRHGIPWVCSTIRDSSSESKYALATFNFPVIGFALFHQRFEYEETSVYVQLNYADGSDSVTKGHTLSVHLMSVFKDFLSLNQSARCQSAWGIFNPSMAFSEDYFYDCSPSNPELCPVGDLSLKHGPFSVRSSSGFSRAFFKDTILSLRGSDSVIGKPLVLGGPDGSSLRLACTKIEELHPRVVSALLHNKRNEKVGFVFMSQRTWIIHEPTLMNIDFFGLKSNKIFEYDISTSPKTAETFTSCDALGEAYNPFNVTVNPREDATPDRFKVGDLSGKLHPFNGPSLSMQLLERTVDVMGPRSVVGRALRLRTGQKSIGCAPLVNPVEQAGEVITALAWFTGEVTGFIRLRQFIYLDGTMSHTTVEWALRVTDGPQTDDHAWHVHELPVVGDANVDEGRCASTGPHYNPFMVNVSSNYVECHVANPLRCEVGDQSHKLGYIQMGADPSVETDINLPLIGPFRVIGRSIVIHVANKGPARFACADLLPDHNAAVFFDLYIALPQPLDRKALTSAIASALNVGDDNIFIHVLFDRPNPSRTGVRVYFIKSNGCQLKQKFIQLLESNPDVFGPFKPCDEDCINPDSASVCRQKRRGTVVTFTGEKVKAKHPCTQTLADMTCGDYDVTVTVRHELTDKFKYWPQYIRVNVSSYGTLLWSGEITYDALIAFRKKFNPAIPHDVTVSPWYPLAGERTGLAWFDPIRRSAVVSNGLDTFRVELDTRQLTILCQHVKYSSPYPESLCHSPEDEHGRPVVKRKRSLELPSKRHVLLLDILNNETVTEIDQCRSFKRVFAHCANEAQTVSACELLLSSRKILETFPRLSNTWFEVCLDAFCQLKKKRCKELKANITAEMSNVPGFPIAEKDEVLSSLNCHF